MCLFCVQTVNEILIIKASLETLNLGFLLRIKIRGTSEKTEGWRALGGLMGQQPYDQRLSCSRVVFPLWTDWFPIKDGGT